MTAKPKHIALVCPGGPITQDLAKQVSRVAASRFGEQAKLHFHPQCFLETGHFAGTDAERSAAFLEVANDPAFDAVWFARGGYGACRLDETLFSQLNDVARTKTYLGYSDTGVILSRLYKLGIGHPAHGPMPTDMLRGDGEAALIRALNFLVSGGSEGLEPTVTNGDPTVAFNITVLAHMIATDWAPDFSGCIILLEDVGEYLYRIDRAMFAIMKNPRLKNAAGVKLGRISDVPENDRPFGQSEEDIIRYWCTRMGVPYLGRADIGHDADNKIVPFGKRLSS